MPPRPSLWRISYLPILRLAGAIIVGPRARLYRLRYDGRAALASVDREVYSTGSASSVPPWAGRGLGDEILAAQDVRIARHLQDISLDHILQQRGLGSVARRDTRTLISLNHIVREPRRGRAQNEDALGGTIA